MNPFLNPFNSLLLLKNYIFDTSRIFKLNQEGIKKYRDKSFRKLIKYAYNVPLYHRKYKQAGINFDDIKKIEDIKKLPFITKKDIKDGYPNDLLPKGINRKKEYVVCTGGSTGKPVSLFTDFKIMSKNVSLLSRDLKIFGLKRKNIRIAHLGNFSENRYDLVTQRHFLDPLEKFISLDNLLNVDVNHPIIEIIEKLNHFKPDIVISYPAIYQHLANLKNKGYGKNVNPSFLLVGGAILDNYTKSYVENAFDSPLLNTYSSVEASGEIAVECPENNWHIHSDFYHLEAIDENNEILPLGKRGQIVITRLFTGGTPVIRYTGMEDWVKLSDNKKCNCGLNTPLIKKLEGRSRANIILPNGKVFPPGAFCFINPVLHKLNTFKVKKYQIIQKKIDEIEILIVIDEELDDKGPSFETIAKNIKQIYRKKTGPDVKIYVKKVDEIVNKKNKRKPAPIVISYLDSDK